MKDATKQDSQVFPGLAEQPFEEWIAGLGRPLPEGFAKSSFANDYWQRGMKVSLAVYNFKLHVKAGIKTKNMLPTRKDGDGQGSQKVD